MYEFPKDFIWGTATSAHQTEGNNTNSDWWEWEQNKKSGQYFPKDKSGIACDSYNRYEEDFDLCAKLNNNAIRISVEWARLEPNEGEFDQKEFEHYRKVLIAARDRGLKTYVTLHHFTNPIWLKNKGGWHSLKTPKLFARYSKKCAQELGDLVDAFLTINEPQVYALEGYVKGIWPPNKKRLSLSLVVQLNMMRAHKKAYRAIKGVGNHKVGIVKNIVWYETDPYKSNVLDQTACKILNFIGRDFFIRPIKNHLDLLGLNYYFTLRIKNLKPQNPGDYCSDLNWWINPGGLESLLVYLKSYDFPVYVTENGLADSNDRIRIHFLRDHLISCANAIRKGAHLKGYFHWSLLDNFEWAEGFWPRFGLVEIDRENNLERKPRKSFYYYTQVCEQNKVLNENVAR